MWHFIWLVLETGFHLVAWTITYRYSKTLFDADKMHHFCIIRTYKLVVMGPGQKILTRVGSGQFFVARVGPVRVSHLLFGFEFGKFPIKMSNFSIFFPSDQKKQKNIFGSGQKVPGSKASRPLICCGSKVSLGQVRAHLYKLALLFQC